MSDVATADVVDLGIERLVHIDARIDEREGEALRDRWEFGRELLAARDGKGRLPNGYMKGVAARTGKSRAELTYRTQFAERFPTEDELFNALNSYSSWFELTQKALKRPVEPVEPAEVQPVPEGQFATIVADPPWRYGNTSTRGSAEDHYPTMSIEELCELDLARERAADQAHLYLWTTAGHLPDAFKVVEAWGFEYKTYLVWVKPQMGMGNYFRVSTELVLFGTCGLPTSVAIGASGTETSPTSGQLMRKRHLAGPGTGHRSRRTARDPTAGRGCNPADVALERCHRHDRSLHDDPPPPLPAPALVRPPLPLDRPRLPRR